MRAPRVYSTEAIVIRQNDLGEADRLLTLYTPNAGKLRAVGKGLRRPTSKLGGHLELFIQSRLLLARGHELDIVTQAESIEPFLGLRDDLWRAGCACYAVELLDRLTEEHEPDPSGFRLLVETLRRISTDNNPEMAVYYFQVLFLGLHGYRPQLHQCVECLNLLEPEGNFFVPDQGGVRCGNCGSGPNRAMRLSVNAFKVIRLLQAGDYATARRLRIDEPLRRELKQLLNEYSEHILERGLRAGRLLDTFREEMAGKPRVL